MSTTLEIQRSGTLFPFTQGTVTPAQIQEELTRLYKSVEDDITSIVKQINDAELTEGAFPVIDLSSYATLADLNTLRAAIVPLLPSGVTPGPYTNTNLTVDAYGRITTASNGSGGGGGTVSGPVSSTVGHLALWDNVAGTLLEDSTYSPASFDPAGSAAAALAAAIAACFPITGAVGGDLAGALPNPTLHAIGAAAGPIGDATHVSTVTIDTKGRVTGLTSTAITFPPSSSDASVFDVMTYGAIGDNNNHGGAEDTAFQNCMAAAITWGTATGKRWKFRIPAGTYLLTKAVTGTLGSSYSGWSVEGDGSGASVVLWAAGASSRGFALTVVNNQAWPPSNSPWKVKGLSLTLYDNNGGTAFSVTIPDQGAYGGQIGGPYFFEDISTIGADSGASQGYWTTSLIIQDPQYLHIKDCVIFGTTGVSLTDIAPYSGNLDGIWIENTAFITSGYCLSMNGGWQTVTLDACLMVSTGSDCFNWTLNSGVGAGGSEDIVLRDCYFNNRGAGSWGVNFQGQARTWVHDCFFDYSAGMAGCFKLDGGLQVKLHDNMFSGGSGAEIGISIGTGSGNTAGIIIHDNEFANLAHDITLGGNAYDAQCHHNNYTLGGSNPQLRAAVISISGTRCITDTPVPYATLPGASVAPDGWRGFINNGAASPTWGSSAGGTGGAIQPVYSDGTTWRYG